MVMGAAWKAVEVAKPRRRFDSVALLQVERSLVSASDATSLRRREDLSAEGDALLIDGSAVRLSANHGHAH